MLRRAVYVLNPPPARAVAKQKKNCALVVPTDARCKSLRYCGACVCAQRVALAALVAEASRRCACVRAEHVHAPAMRSACHAAALRQAINRNVRHLCDALGTNAAQPFATLPPLFRGAGAQPLSPSRICPRALRLD